MAQSFDALLKHFGLSGDIGSYIDGEIVLGQGETITLVDPSTAKPLMAYADGGSHIAETAAEAAEGGFKRWQAISKPERGRIMFAVAQAVRAAVPELAELETLVAGKPIRDTRVEVTKVAEMFEYYAGWCDKLTGDVIPVPTTHLNYTLPQPYGVVLQITPWNAPIFTAGWQIAPALAAGNSVLIKPSEFTPLTTLILAKLAEQAGVPAGCVNVLLGRGQTIVPAAIKTQQVKKVIFVGSPSAGAAVASAAAMAVKPCVLELGGKSANIVFDDANLKQACLGAQAAIFSGAGQSCVAGSRVLVHRSVYDQFVDMMSKGAQQIQVGSPSDTATEVGPIANARQFAHVKAMVEKGAAEGAVIASGKYTLPGDGFYVRPTVLAGVNNQMAVAREEIFGPVVAAIPFDDEEDAVALANDQRFGLAGAVWTNDVGRAHRVAAQVNAGTFWINSYKAIHVSSPFGGFGDSGYGRSSGLEGLREYLVTKSVWVETAAVPTIAFGYVS